MTYHLVMTPIIVAVDAMPSPGVLGYLAALAPAFASLVAVFAVIIAGRTARHSRDTLRNETMKMLYEKRYGRRMYKAKMFMRAFADECKREGNTIEDTYRAMLREQHLSEEDDDCKPDLDRHRRFFYVYFVMVRDLFKAKIIRERDLRFLVNSSDTTMLLSISHPLERAVRERMNESTGEDRPLGTELVEFFCQRFGPLPQCRKKCARRTQTLNLLSPPPRTRNSRSVARWWKDYRY